MLLFRKIPKPLDFTGFFGIFCYRTYISLYGEEMKNIEKSVKENLLVLEKSLNPLILLRLQDFLLTALAFLYMV